MNRAWRSVALVVLGVAMISALTACFHEVDGNGNSGNGSPDLVSAEVIEVIDGDTIRVELGDQLEVVRFAGIDTPEQDYDMCFADEAENRVSDQLSNSTVWFDREGRGDNDRLIAVPFLDAEGNQNLNERLVRQGFAVTLSDRYNEAENSAQQDNAGLWGKCFVDEPSLVIRDIQFDGNDEVTTIANQGSNSVELDDWMLFSSPWGGRNQQCPLPNTTLAAGEEIRIHTGHGADEAVDPPKDVECTGAFVWLNEGDSGWLMNPGGMFTDLFEFKGGYRSF